jgi:hypothetical protein
MAIRLGLNGKAGFDENPAFDLSDSLRNDRNVKGI